MGRRLSSAENRVLTAGIALALAILLVGPASHEVVRHCLQAAPLMACCVAAIRWPGLLRWLLAPFLLFWLLIAVLIWLFLLHVANIVTGTFNPIEIAMTIAMGAASVFGLACFPTVRRRYPLLPGLGAAAIALALQIGAFAISLEPWVAHADGHVVSSAAPVGSARNELA
jgi:hypothetical protein